MTVHADFEHEAQAVYAALIDPQYLVDRNLALGELSAECEVEQDGDCATIKAVREVRRKLPGVLARIFDADSTLDMTEEWRADEDGWRGNWTMTVRGQPVTIFGSFELLPTQDGCRYSVTHQVRAKVPLVREQVQKFILGETTKGARDELEYLRTYLD
jgi:hypothetical protein